jgi:hypothetical protein
LKNEIFYIGVALAITLLFLGILMAFAYFLLHPTRIALDGTNALVFATLLQFVALLYQAHRLRQTVLVTKDVANATEKTAAVAEKALTQLEAPVVFVKITQNGLKIEGNQVSLGELVFCFVNHGRTPAHITEFYEAIRPHERGTGMPQPIDASNDDASVMPPWGVVAPPNDASHEFRHNLLPALFTGMQDALLDPNKSVLFFMGYVKYVDIFGGRYTVGFCFIFDATFDRWVLAGGAGYNYCNKHAEDGAA